MDTLQKTACREACSRGSLQDVAQPSEHGIHGPVTSDTTQGGPLRRSQPDEAKEMMSTTPFGLYIFFSSQPLNDSFDMKKN